MSLAKKAGKVCLGLAAGTMCINPALAQQSAPFAVSASKQAQASSADKEVTLAPDGTFRAAVLTRSGFLVAAANLEMVPGQKDAGDPFKALTGTRGMAVVSGLKPGLYHVNVDSPQGTYRGILLVRSAPVANVSLSPPPLVTFMLAPPQCPDQEKECPRATPFLEELEAAEGLGVGEGLGGAGLLFPVLGLTGAAAAIALPLSLAHHRHHRASP